MIVRKGLEAPSSDRDSISETRPNHPSSSSRLPPSTYTGGYCGTWEAVATVQGRELNVLNCQFQSDLVDIASILGYADAVIQNLKKKFLRDSRDCGTKYLQKFVQQTHDGELKFHDAGGDSHVHALKFDRIEGSTRRGSFEDCTSLAKDLVAKIVENLKSRMVEDMPLFDACKLFSPKHYPSKELEMESSCQQWLETILNQYGCLVDVEKCKGELDSFTTVFGSNLKTKNFRDAWDVCRGDFTMCVSFPNMMRLWEIVFVILVNTIATECGFSVQNSIKSMQRTSMRLSTLENLMFIRLNGPNNKSDVPSSDVFEAWSKQKNRCINGST